MKSFISSNATSEIKTVIPDSAIRGETLVPPLWKIKTTSFQKLVQEFKSLPQFDDLANTCPRNNVMIELVENGKSTVKVSCYDNSTVSRKKYVKFSKKMI